MEIKAGDWVRTKTGEVGKVELIVRLSAYIQFGDGGSHTLQAFLLSELTKIDPQTKE